MPRFDPPIMDLPPQTLVSRRPAWVPSLVATLALAVCCQPARSESWTDNTGNFQVDARFVDFDGDILVLQKKAGNTIRVPARRLSTESVVLARKLAGTATSTTPSFQTADRPESGPPQVAPPRPATANATTRSPQEAADTTPEAAVRTLLNAIEAGDLAVMWSQLPPTYQTDVNEVVHTFGQNMDPGIWNLGIGVAQKAVKILQTRQQFITQAPALSSLPVDPETITESLDVPLKALTLLLNSDLADVEKLQTLDLAAFARGQGTEIAGQLSKLPTSMPDELNSLTLGAGLRVNVQQAKQAFESIVNAKVKNVQQTENTATLQMSPENGDTATIEMVLVEGKWIPTDLANEWDAQMAAAKTALLAMKPQLEANKMMIMLPLQMVDGAANQILAAKSQEEFDQVIAGLTKNVGAIVGPLMGQSDGAPALEPSANINNQSDADDQFDFGNGTDVDFADTALNDDTNLGDNADFGESDFEDTDVENFGFEDNDDDGVNNADFGEEK